MEFSRQQISGYPDTREALLRRSVEAVPRALGECAMAMWTIAGQTVHDVRNHEVVLFRSSTITD